MIFGKKPAPAQPIMKVVRWRNSRADCYALSFDGTIFLDYGDFVDGIRAGRMVPVWGDGSLDEGSLDSVLGTNYVLPPALQAIISQIPVNPEIHEQYLKDKELEKRFNQ